MAFDLLSTQSAVVDIVFNILKILVALSIGGIAVWWGLRVKRYDTQNISLVIDPKTNRLIGLEYRKAGTYADRKTKNKLFYLKGNKAGLDPDEAPYINVMKPGFMSPTKAVLSVKTGENSYRFIHPQFDGESFKPTVGEEDVNWALNVFEAQHKIFGTTWLDKVLPYIPLIIVGFVMVIIVFTLMKNADTVVEILTLMKDIQVNQAKMQLGTVIS